MPVLPAGACGLEGVDSGRQPATPGARAHRGRGIATALLEAAPGFARSRGARVLEGYPVDLDVAGRRSNAELYHGVASTFRACGFEEAGRTSPTRPVMRLPLG